MLSVARVSEFKAFGKSQLAVSGGVLGTERASPPPTRSPPVCMCQPPVRWLDELAAPQAVAGTPGNVLVVDVDGRVLAVGDGHGAHEPGAEILVVGIGAHRDGSVVAVGGARGRQVTGRPAIFSASAEAATRPQK